MGYKYKKRCAKSKESTPFCSYCFAFRPQSLVFCRGERWYLFAVYDNSAPNRMGFIEAYWEFRLQIVWRAVRRTAIFNPYRTRLGAFCLIMYKGPITSPDAEATHRGYWEKKITLPIEHPLGNKHHPDGTASALLNLQTIQHHQMKCYKGLEKIIDLQTLSLRNYNPTRYLKIHYLILQI